MALACAATGLLAYGRCRARAGGASRIAWAGARCSVTGTWPCRRLLPLPLFAAATDGSTALLLIANVLVGSVLGTFVVGAYLSERLPVSLRATGIAVSAGWATALIGGTAPLLGSILHRAGADIGIPLFIRHSGCGGPVRGAPGLRARTGPGSPSTPRVGPVYPSSGDVRGLAQHDRGEACPAMPDRRDPDRATSASPFLRRLRRTSSALA